MDFEGALRARLTGAIAVTTLVGQRIYWEDRPQASALPAITLEMVIDDRDQHMGGFQTVLDCLVQVDVWAMSFASKKAIKEAVIAALAPPVTANGINFRGATNVTAHPQNERIETAYIYHEIIEMRIHYSPA